MDFGGVKLTWLGHGTVVIRTPERKKLLVDPWLQGNPSCPADQQEIEVAAILATHGHPDHIGDIVMAQHRCSGPLVAIHELARWLELRQHVLASKLVSMNKGGTAKLEGLDVEVGMTEAQHSSSWIDDDGAVTYLGDPVGYTIRCSRGPTFYVAGDTGLFGDMSLIAELWRPEVAILPIGDRFTMGPRAAAIASRLLRVKCVIPYHYGTFPLLTGTPEQLREELAKEAPEVELMNLEIGQPYG